MAVRRALTTESERARLETREADLGEWATDVGFGFSSRGVVTSLYAPDLRLPTSARSGSTPEQVGAAFINDNFAMLGLDEPTSLELVRTMQPAPGRTLLQYREVIDGRPVFGSVVALRVLEAERIGWLVSHVTPVGLVPDVPALVDEESAIDTATRMSPVSDRDVPRLGYLDPELMGDQPGPVRLVWRVPLDRLDVFVDAVTGRILREDSRSAGDTNREIYDCPGCTRIATFYTDLNTGDALRHADECRSPLWTCANGNIECRCVPPHAPVGLCSQPTSYCSHSPMEWRATAARDSTLDIHNYLLGRLGRDGWDDGSTGVTLHRMMVVTGIDVTSDLRDFLPYIFADPAAPSTEYWGACSSGWYPLPHAYIAVGSKRSCRDVIAHEVVHAMDEVSLNIANSRCAASGAIEEGFGDVIGEFVDRYATGAGPDWVHGTGCATCPGERNSNLATPSAVSVATLSRTGAYGGCAGGVIPPDSGDYSRPQPDTFANYHHAYGAHWNSTIVSTMGYLMGREPSAGAVTRHGISVSGIGEAYASGVWYRALVEDLGGAVTFTDLRNALSLECYGVGAYLDCQNAVSAGGSWSGDSVVSGVSVTDAPDIVLHPEPGLPNRAYMVYTGATGNVLVRSSDFGVLGPWSAATTLTAGPPPQPVVAASIPGGIALVCYTSAYGGIWCDHRTNVGWIGGPDPGGSGVAAGVALAHFNGAMHLVYRRSSDSELFHRMLPDGSWTWTAAVSVGRRAAPHAGSFSLASGDEDYYVPPASSNELWLVFSANNGAADAHRIELARLVGSSWVSVGYSSEVLNNNPLFTIYHETNRHVSVAFFRGRLHMSTTSLGYDAPAPTYEPALWYRSCAPPCETDAAWSRFVRQDGTSQAESTLVSGDVANSMLLLHRVVGSNTLYRRIRWSD